ncbi:MAG: hypothetical protein APF76_04525 [Desulfitibacter sp. BRH_c19]|nr:MAG: hypothetical protein APF76_04525 [Desulfitibacter sp. BRH_c19]
MPQECSLKERIKKVLVMLENGEIDSSSAAASLTYYIEAKYIKMSGLQLIKKEAAQEKYLAT